MKHSVEIITQKLKLQELELQEHLEPVFIGHLMAGGDTGKVLDVMAFLA